MLVEDADRYGISQLHQLRGRIGRGEHASLCLLFGRRDSRRLQALARESDGFRLAEVDLELRGDGELAGTRQSGHDASTGSPSSRATRSCSSARALRPDRARPRPGARDRAPRACAAARTAAAADPGVRVVAGTHRRTRALRAPTRGQQTRPTSDRVREALFSILASVEGAEVLDLFAGSGALGIEALSRGAAERHLRRLGGAAPWRPSATTWSSSACRPRCSACRRCGRSLARRSPTANTISSSSTPHTDWRAPSAPSCRPHCRRSWPPEARVVAESDRRAPLELDLPLLRERQYGDTLIRVHVAR